jgi:uncharacterized RDD family membrane protein YckC
VTGYIAPDGSYTADYPPVWRRAAAATIDWVLAYVVFLVASIAAGFFQTLGLTTLSGGDLRSEVPGTVLLVLSQVLTAAPVVAYFALYWATGSTLGMRALDIELVESDTGRPPSRRRALVRACVAFVIAIAVNNVYLVVASEPLHGYSAFQRAIIGASLTVAGFAFAAKAWLFLDERRQTLVDRLFGLVYVEELVFTQTTPFPWTTSGRV